MLSIFSKPLYNILTELNSHAHRINLGAVINPKDDLLRIEPDDVCQIFVRKSPSS